MLKLGVKMNILNEKKSYFMDSTNFKLHSRIYGNLINNCEFSKFVISVRGGHCDYSPWVPKHLATPLHTARCSTLGSDLTASKNSIQLQT
jgi:hypothetical protein